MSKKEQHQREMKLFKVKNGGGDKGALKKGIPVRFCLQLVCFGRPDMELVWQSACLVLSGLSSILVGHWCLDHYSWLLTTDLDRASSPCV